MAKQFLSSLLMITIFLVGSTFAAAQVYDPSATYFNVYTQRAWNNPASSQLDQAILQGQQTAQLLLMNNLMESWLSEDLGRMKIRRGIATTYIKSVPQESVVESIALQAKTPPEQTQARNMAALSLQTFNNILKAKNLTPYDAADGRALAFVLSYMAYHDQDPGDGRLQKMRRWFQKDLINSITFQGTLDKGKQKEYENMALTTMYAVRAYQLSKRTNISAKEKQTAQNAARENAGQILSRFWNKSVSNIELTTDSLGFGDRGGRVVAEGKIATTFERSNQSLVAAQNAQQYGKEESYYINLLAEFDSEVERRNGQTGDAAWVNAVAIAQMYEVYTGMKIRLTERQFNWVLNEMKKDILADADYQGLSNEEKQKYYEDVALRSMIIYDRYRTVKRSPTNYASVFTEADRIHEDAEKRLYALFQPRSFYNLELTENEFSPKR